MKKAHIKALLLFSLILLSINVLATKVAVTDLTYSTKAQEYIHIVDYKNRGSIKSSSSAAIVNQYTGITTHDEIISNSKTDYFEYENSYSYIEAGELRNFTGDIKGEMLKSKHFQLIQSRPVYSERSESVYDIIARIKKRYYRGADYVLFGSVSNLSFSEDNYQSQNATVKTHTFNLTLTAEFSLINTKNYEVIASFSAIGKGSNSNINSLGSNGTPNRSLVVAEVSKSLGIDVINQLNSQLGLIDTSISNKEFTEKLEDKGKKDIDVVVFH